jgi:hypothetical protein
MPIDVEKIRDAFSKFEEEDYVGAKEILQQEIHTAKNEFLQSKLGLEKDVDEACGGPGTGPKDGTGKGKKKKMVVKEEEEETE